MVVLSVFYNKGNTTTSYYVQFRKFCASITKIILAILYKAPSCHPDFKLSNSSFLESKPRTKREITEQAIPRYKCSI